jgi:hypothetical protein
MMETRLSHAQIESWADNLRYRIPAIDRAAYLEKAQEVTGQIQMGPSFFGGGELINKLG